MFYLLCDVFIVIVSEGLIIYVGEASGARVVCYQRLGTRHNAGNYVPIGIE